MNAAQRRLIAAAEQAEAAHLTGAREAVLRQYRAVTLTRAEQALTAALSLPRAQRPAAIRGVLSLIGEAMVKTRTPSPALLPVLRAAVRGRVLNAQDLAALLDFPALDTAGLQADALTRARQDMNRYWAGEQRRFRDDVARTIREAARRNLTPERAADLLQERLGVSRSRAVLIATDQIRTAQARAEQGFMRAAGVKAFRWHSPRDAVARPAHVALHGQVFRWRAAPELPGEAVNCRCRALPARE